MRLKEILESDELLPNEAREVFIELVTDLNYLLDNYQHLKSLDIIDSNIDFLKQWVNICLKEFSNKNLINNPDINFIVELGPEAIAKLEHRRTKL